MTALHRPSSWTSHSLSSGWWPHCYARVVAAPRGHVPPLHPTTVTYRSPQALQVAGEGLELPPVLAGLLLGCAQGLCVPGGCVRQVCELGGDTCAVGRDHMAGMCPGGTWHGDTTLLCSTGQTWPQ